MAFTADHKADALSRTQSVCRLWRCFRRFGECDDVTRLLAADQIFRAAACDSYDMVVCEDNCTSVVRYQFRI